MEGVRRARDSAPARYRPRRPSQSVLYRCVQEHLETWLAQCRDGHADDRPVPPYVETDRNFNRTTWSGRVARGGAGFAAWGSTKRSLGGPVVGQR